MEDWLGHRKDFLMDEVKDLMLDFPTALMWAAWMELWWETCLPH